MHLQIRSLRDRKLDELLLNYLFVENEFSLDICVFFSFSILENYYDLAFETKLMITRFIVDESEIVSLMIFSEVLFELQ